jgi:hypothetical protein
VVGWLASACGVDVDDASAFSADGEAGGDGIQSCVNTNTTCGFGTCSIDCAVDSQSCTNATVDCGPNACAATCSGYSKPTLDGCNDSCDCQAC